MFSYKFWKFLNKSFPLKTLCDKSGWSLYILWKRISKVRLKLCEKQVIYVAYKLKLPHKRELLTATNFEKILRMLPRYWLFLLIKNKENFFDQENCFVRGRSSWMLFTHAWFTGADPRDGPRGLVSPKIEHLKFWWQPRFYCSFIFALLLFYMFYYFNHSFTLLFLFYFLF